MSLKILLLLAVSIVCAVSLTYGLAPPAVASEVQVPSEAGLLQETLTSYCITCHNDRLRTGDLALEGLDLSQIGAHGETWEKVVSKLRTRAMPPVGRPRPGAKTYDTLTAWLESEIDRFAANQPNPGRTEAFHRLNRTEYQNAVRDLLALDVDVTDLLPVDDGSYGFDNIAGVLRVSPTLLERYMGAARKISALAVGAPVSIPVAEIFSIHPELRQSDSVEGLPFGTRGGTVVRHHFPVDGEYVLKIDLARNGYNIVGLREPHEIEVSIDGESVQRFSVGEPADRGPRYRIPKGKSGEPLQRYYDTQFENVRPRRAIRAPADAHLQFRVSVGAGPRQVGVTFLKKTAAQIEGVRLPFMRPAIERGNTGGQPYIGTITITGPFDEGGPGDTPSRQQVFLCRPSRAIDELACATRILSTLTRRAYRRPATDTDLADLMPFFHEGTNKGGFDAGIGLALERLLVSPEFIFRIERDPLDIPRNTAYRISDRELASRLSFFLWSSIPDEELLGLAESGRLSDETVLKQQVHRMLADERSQTFVNNFSAQWLYLRNVPTVVPNQRLFPDFEESLRRAFRQETELLLDSVLREERSVLELLNADYTFVNERLARHYGMPNISGSHFRRVAISDEQRRGLLGHGSILTVTSYANRTSPVLRGKWILENILGMPPPPPPANVPDLEDKNREGQVLSMRDRMVQHRANPACAICHSMMDPIGLALENFDAVGRWRTHSEAGTPIDASGALPDGATMFEGPAGLRRALLRRPELFVATLTEKLLTYALGRGLEYYDAPAVREIVRESELADYRFSSIVLGIVQSEPFRMRRSPS